eukprot:TRINITY_DN8314_c0_g1_i1.p2 TRINITY_DN8314_c0_g1~~TRINITY_DN8314_c0_g1_i1.p2  ORF type:complete len:57 (-),score=4.63 TRINITY_DN8314_c0_g1_i1:6-176(-)
MVFPLICLAAHLVALSFHKMACFLSLLRALSVHQAELCQLKFVLHLGGGGCRCHLH